MKKYKRGILSLIMIIIVLLIAKGYISGIVNDMQSNETANISVCSLYDGIE